MSIMNFIMVVVTHVGHLIEKNYLKKNLNLKKNQSHWHGYEDDMWKTMKFRILNHIKCHDVDMFDIWLSSQSSSVLNIIV